MDNVILSLPEIEYQNGAFSSYAVLKFNKCELLDYQVKMISRNIKKFNSILCFDVSRMNNGINISYNITSKIQLSDLLCRKTLKKNELIQILLDIVNTLLLSEEYFLYPQNYILHTDYIFINAANLNIGLIYVPIIQNTNVINNIKEFIIEIIIQKAKLEDSLDDSYIQKIIKFIKNDNISLIDFSRLLNEIMYSSNNKYNLSDFSQPIQIINTKDTNIKIKQEIEKKDNKNVYKITSSKDCKIEVPFEIEIPMINNTKNEVYKEVKENKNIKKNNILSSLRNNKTNYVAISIIELGVVFFIVYLLKASFFMNDTISRIFGILILISSVEYFVFSKLIYRNNTKINNSKNSNSIKQKDSKDNTNNIKQKDSEGKTNSIDKLYNNKVLDVYKINNNTEDTVILKSENIPVFAFLKILSEGMDRIIYIKSNRMIIGRFEKDVDIFLNNPAISKIHAEIIKREGSYYIKDCNSVNGTFINNERILGNTEYEIKNGESISFASINCKFYNQGENNGNSKQ